MLAACSDSETSSEKGQTDELTLSISFVEREYTYPFRQAEFNISTTNADSARFLWLDGEIYDRISPYDDDEYIVEVMGRECSAEEVEFINTPYGVFLTYHTLYSHTRYVLLMTAKSSRGDSVTKKVEHTTAWYIDPAATWTTVSTTSEWHNVNEIFAEPWGVHVDDLTGITVQKVDGQEIYRLVDVFRTQQFVDLGFVPDGSKHSYLIIDATDPQNVAVELYENNIGINYSGFNSELHTYGIWLGSAYYYFEDSPLGYVAESNEDKLVIELGGMSMHCTYLNYIGLSQVADGGQLVIPLTAGF